MSEHKPFARPMVWWTSPGRRPVAGEITISFGGDTNQAAQFARSVPDFVLKDRFADLVKLDLQALEQEMRFDVETTRPWCRLIRR